MTVVPFLVSVGDTSSPRVNILGGLSLFSDALSSKIGTKLLSCPTDLLITNFLSILQVPLIKILRKLSVL